MEVQFNRRLEINGETYLRDHVYEVELDEKILENLIKKGFATLLSKPKKAKKKSAPKKEELPETSELSEVVEESEDSE